MTFLHKTPLYLLTIALVFSATATVHSDDNALSSSTRTSISAKLNKSEGKRGTAGCLIVDLDTGEELFAHNADEMLIPASNMKLVTTIAALHELGGDFEFVTRVMADGALNGGTLEGDLCIMGGGDPNISGRFYNDDPLALFKKWAGEIKAHGITEVSGDLKFDTTLFGGESFNEGWPQDDQYIKWYCAQVSALGFNDNCVGIRVLPNKAGQKATIEVIPPTAAVTIINETTTAAGKKGAEIGIVRPRGENTITVKGKVYEKATWGYFTDVTVDDPASFAATVFKETLAAEGVNVKGGIAPKTLTADELKQCTTLVEHHAKLLDALTPINTNSQNLHAEMLFRQLGLRYAGKGTFKTSRVAVEGFLKKNGLLRDGMYVQDGSGLGRDNRVSPRLLVDLLKLVAEHEQFDAFKTSLAVSGETGTLEKRLRESAVKGQVFAKTGYINGVRSLSGYIITGNRRIAFSILMNNCVYTKAMQDEIVTLLAKAVA